MIKLVLISTLVIASWAASPYRAGDEQNAAILRLDNEVYPDGSYSYAYETQNGIAAQESGQQKAIGNSYGNVAQGSFQWTSPEGIPIQIQYIADENGYQPVGNVLPTPAASVYRSRRSS